MNNGYSDQVQLCNSEKYFWVSTILLREIPRFVIIVASVYILHPYLLHALGSQGHLYLHCTALLGGTSTSTAPKTTQHQPLHLQGMVQA